MVHAVLLGAGLAIVSGTMNGLFTFPMRFLSRWEWENVWSIFIVSSCLVLPCVLIGVTAPRSWAILWHAPVGALGVALLTGFLWGFGAIMFGQSVSALGISLANTLVLAISSALGSFVPLVVLSPARLRTHAGRLILLGVAIEIAGIVLCGFAGRVRESGGSAGVARGRLVGRARPPAIGLLLTLGAGVLSAVFNIGFALAQPIADAGMRAGLGVFASTNLIWLVMLGAGSVANLGFCGVLALRNRSFAKFAQPGSGRLYVLATVMGLLWGGSIFVYGAAVPRLGALGKSIGWPLSLAMGLVVANVIGLAIGEWTQAPARARALLFAGISVSLIAIVVLSRAG